MPLAEQRPMCPLNLYIVNKRKSKRVRVRVRIIYFGTENSITSTKIQKINIKSQ